MVDWVLKDFMDCLELDFIDGVENLQLLVELMMWLQQLSMIDLRPGEHLKNEEAFQNVDVDIFDSLFLHCLLATNRVMENLSNFLLVAVHVSRFVKIVEMVFYVLLEGGCLGDLLFFVDFGKNIHINAIEWHLWHYSHDQVEVFLVYTSTG